MTDLYLVEPEKTNPWYPYGGCRPLSELRVGAWLIRERWEAATGSNTVALLAPAALQSFVEDRDLPEVRPIAAIPGPALVGAATFAPTGVAVEDLPSRPATLTNDGAAVGWWVPDGHSWAPGMSADVAVDIHGISLHGAWDVLTATEHLLAADAADFTHETGDEIPDGSVVIGDPHDVVLLDAKVEPNVVFDTREGPVVVERNAYVKGATRFEGPVVVGPGTHILGGLIRHSAIGPMCKVRGEVQNSVFIGYANKVHDGFLGHSVLGRWVNLGAGTTTSNLKNTYGTVRVQVGDDRIETDRTNIGTIFGDHAKVAIGTYFDTGSLVGTGANVFGSSRPPKYIPPFAWGVDGQTMHRDGFLDMAQRVLPRRQVEFSDAMRASLGSLYDNSAM